MAAARDTDAMVTDAVSGRPARAMRTAHAEEMARHPDDRAAFPQMYALSAPILAASEPDAASFQLYGQAAALARDLPAGDLVGRLVAEARAVIAGLRAG